MKDVIDICKKNKLINVYKFFFILFIVCLHSSIIFSETYFVRGYLGVEFFFMVSGFFLAKSYICNPEISPFRWIVNKAKKIYPVFLSSLVLLLLAKYVILSHSSMQVSWQEFLIENSGILYEVLFLNRSGLSYYMLNPPDWFLSAMMIIGFVLYTLLKFLNRTVLHGILFAGIIFFTYYIIKTAGSLDVHTGNVVGWVDISLLRSFISMAIGIELFLLLKKLKVIQNYYVASFAEGFTLFGCFEFLVNRQHAMTDWIVFFLYALLIWTCYACHGFFHRFFSKPFFTYWGQYSTSLYLTHWFINQYGHHFWGGYWSIGIYVLSSVCFAVIFQKSIDRLMKICQVKNECG